MFTGMRAFQIYTALGLTAVYGHVIQKLIELNWFDNAGLVTIVLMVFVLLAAQIVIYNMIEWFARS